MSRVLKSDKLKPKKQGTQVLRPDVASNRNELRNKQSTLKTSSQLKEHIPITDEKVKTKNTISNAASTTSNNVNVGVHRSQFQGRRNGSVHTNKLVSGKVSSSSQQKQEPLRAKNVSSTFKVIKETNQKRTSPTTNSIKIDKKSGYKKQSSVLDTPHNVTVCSPPPKKKNDSGKVVSNDESCKLVRKESRTLAPEEIIVLKTESAKMRSEEKIQKENSIERILAIGLKEPVAFEINFEDKDIREKSVSAKKNNSNDALDSNDEDINYSDDFESYESDFETGSSTHSLTRSDTSQNDNDDTDISANKYEISNQNVELFSNEIEQQNESEVTRTPVTEIQTDKEKQLDSGHYDMNFRKMNYTKSSNMSVLPAHSKADSLETFSLGISEQLDSGISTCTISIPESYSKNIKEVIYGGYRNFYTKPIVRQRGSELMSKIQLDVLSFDLANLKPISYDIFMQNFGKLNTNQSFAQTQDNKVNVEQQTVVHETRSIWTQHPAHFDLEMAENLHKNGIYNQHCCGVSINESHDKLRSYCELDQSLNALKQLHSRSSKRNYQKLQRRPISYERLNAFLLRSSLLIDQILGCSNTNTDKKTIQKPEHENDRVLKRASEKYFYIETNLLNTLHVLKLFANNKYNLLVTVHESSPDTNVYTSDFSNLLMVWCANTCDKPLRLLTTWSQVSKVEISHGSSDIVVAALRDGSIALWDLRETHSFCSKLDGYLTHFAATQSLIPSCSEDKNNSKLIMDLGSCLDVKSFKSHTNNMLTQTTFSRSQFVTLHDSGIVTGWTLVENSDTPFSLTQIEKCERSKYSSSHTHTFEYTSPWARVKLKQSSLLNIKECLETKSQHPSSRFEKTKTFFQKNIYSDNALKELNECTPEVGRLGLRYTSLECGSENVFICTNRNYILMCSKTLKMDKLKRIIINESQFLFPTALKVLSNEHFIAVGLSNGVVIILNCHWDDKVAQSNKITKKPSLKSDDATHRNSILDNNSITGKSCAIQNILLNAQKSYEYMDFDQEYRPSTAACITLIDSKKKPFELRLLDEQIVMGGSTLRKNLIKSLELSSDGWYLFALANGHARIYDFCSDQEISYEEPQETGTIMDIATGKCGYRENTLMILRLNSKVEVHILKK